MSKTILDTLRDHQWSLKPSKMVKLLEDVPGGLVNQSTLVFTLRQAFPEIPLRVLIEASGWSHVCVGGFDDDEFDLILAPWIGSPPRTKGG